MEKNDNYFDNKSEAEKLRNVASMVNDIVNTKPDDSLEVKTELLITFNQSPYYKEEISENQMCLLNIGLQIKAAKISSLSPFTLTLEKPIICKKNDICLLIKPESTTVRIIGSGKIN